MEIYFSLISSNLCCCCCCCIQFIEVNSLNYIIISDFPFSKVTTLSIHLSMYIHTVCDIQIEICVLHLMWMNKMEMTPSKQYYAEHFKPSLSYEVN